MINCRFSKTQIPTNKSIRNSVAEIARPSNPGFDRVVEELFTFIFYQFAKIVTMSLIAGIDEVGRGPWAGPLVVGVVVLDSDDNIKGVDDSKKLTKKKRELIRRLIQQKAVSIGVGWVDAPTVDEIGLSKALRLATERAFVQLSPQVREKIEQIVIDGTIRLLDDERAITMVKADSRVPAVSAASIIAKVSRDSYMAELDKVFAEYDFAGHVGYGTAKHRASIIKSGVIQGIHRQSFAPIAELLGKPKLLSAPKRIDATTGRIAENIAADYLRSIGHRIVVQNWKTKFCEIDIISDHNGVIHFTEVKYRASNRQGDGLDAITPRKLRQMRFAAEIYLNQHFPNGAPESRISAISLTDNPPIIDRFIESIT